MKRVIVFDDHMLTVNHVQYSIEEEDFDVDLQHCHTVNEANRILEGGISDDDLLILDIMMLSRGLPHELREKTDGNKITGWIWLWDYQRQVRNNNSIGMSNTVIYSAYLDDLNKYISALDSNSEEYIFYNKLRKIEKDGMKGLEEIKQVISTYLHK